MPMLTVFRGQMVMSASVTGEELQSTCRTDIGNRRCRSNGVNGDEVSLGRPSGVSGDHICAVS